MNDGAEPLNPFATAKLIPLYFEVFFTPENHVCSSKEDLPNTVEESSSM